MKKKYCIGFFVVLFVFVSLLGIGYQVSYQYVMDRQMARQQDKQQRSVAVKGEAEKNEGCLFMSILQQKNRFLSPMLFLCPIAKLQILEEKSIRKRLIPQNMNFRS